MVPFWPTPGHYRQNGKVSPDVHHIQLRVSLGPSHPTLRMHPQQAALGCMLWDEDRARVTDLVNEPGSGPWV